MKFGSVCSGIEAASVAWESLGFEAQWFSEIEHFPSEVLKYRYPTVPNLGDMTKLTENETFKTSSINLLVGGTPCQSFSVAGLRGGLADPRGNLMLTFLALADAKKPRWIVWENVPGVLSSNGGRDFGTFLGALGELGYGFAYRVLDAQHFGVAQRRRRVFVVGYLGDWRPAAAVLFERESLSRDSKPSRKKGQETSTDAQGSVGATGFAGNVESQVAACLQTTCDDYSRADGFNTVIEQVAHPFRKVRRAQSETDFETWEKDEKANTLNCFDQGDVRSTNVVAQPIAVDVYNQTIDGQTSATLTKAVGGTNTSGPKIAQPIMLDDQGGSVMRVIEDGVCGTLRRETHGHEPLVAQPIPINTMTVMGRPSDELNPRMGIGIGNPNDPCPTLTKAHSHAVAQPIAVDTYNYTTNEKTTQTIRSQSDTEHIGAVMQPISLDCYNQSITGDKVGIIREQHGTNMNAIAVDCFNQTINEKTTQTIGSSASDVNHYGAVLEPTIIDRAAFNQGQNAQYEPRIEEGQTMSSLVARGPHAVQHTMAIRRLTPKECERLQGFQDDWTKIPYRNKPADQCPDGPRYKACGNSMAVPVMRWIGQRIQLIDTIIN